MHPASGEAAAAPALIQRTGPEVTTLLDLGSGTTRLIARAQEGAERGIPRMLVLNV
jgi:hypothetical protein